MTAGLEAFEKICMEGCKYKDISFADSHTNCKKHEQGFGCEYCIFYAGETHRTVEVKLKALEVLKKVINTTAVYRNMLDACLECGWITADEYRIAREALER